MPSTLQRVKDIITLTSEELRHLSLAEVKAVLQQVGLPPTESTDAGITLLLQHAIEL